MCPCGSGDPFAGCCRKYLTAIPGPTIDPRETMLIGWFEKCRSATSQEFGRLAKSYVFRISWFLDGFVERYFTLPLPSPSAENENSAQVNPSIKENTLLTINGALSCLAEGLFMQSGILLRSVLENCMVLVDVFEHREQMKKLLQD